MSKEMIDYKMLEYQKKFARLIARHADSDGTFTTSISSLRLIRSSSISEPLRHLVEPSLYMVAQGSKLVVLANESYQYDPATYLVASVLLPITGQIISATPQEPFLSIQLSFTTDEILDILKNSDLGWNKQTDCGRGIMVNKSNAGLLDAIIRLMQLLDTPSDISVLAPLIIREVLYRILKDDHGNLVKQFAIIGSQARSIEKVIHLISNNFSKPLRIATLAREVNMSPSSLHNHFKKVTTMSPLQYQKQIRLQEARRLLLSETLDAADVSFQVGYESPSQFSREYARMFGLPPISDINRLRHSLNAKLL